MFIEISFILISLLGRYPSNAAGGDRPDATMRVTALLQTLTVNHLVLRVALAVAQSLSY